MYVDDLSGDEFSRIMKRLGEAGKKYQAEKQRLPISLFAGRQKGFSMSRIRGL